MSKLLEAVLSGLDDDAVKDLLEHESEYDPAALVAAAREGPPVVFNLLLNAGIRLLDDESVAASARIWKKALDESLAAAIEASQTAFVNTILSCNANPCSKDRFGATMLILAVTFAEAEVVTLLCDAGAVATIRQKDADGNSHIIIACERGDPQIVEALVDRGVEVDAVVIAATVNAKNNHLLGMLVRTQWARLAANARGVQIQPLLRKLDPNERHGVRQQLLAVIAELQSRTLVGALVESFRRQPYSTFSDAVFLSGAFRAIAR